MRYDFNRRERRAPEVANVTKADVVAAWNKWYAPGVTTRKPLMLHFYSTKDAEVGGPVGGVDWVGWVGSVGGVGGWSGWVGEYECYYGTIAKVVRPPPPAARHPPPAVRHPPTTCPPLSQAEGLISADTCADDADADGSTDGSTDERTVLTDLASLRSFKEGRPKYPSVALKWWS